MALQQGTIDAQENPFEVIYANRLYEQQDYVILTNHLPASHNLLISQVVYNGLSDTDKELIMAVGKAAIQYSREQCDARLSRAYGLGGSDKKNSDRGTPRRRSGAAAGQVLRCLLKIYPALFS